MTDQLETCLELWGQQNIWLREHLLRDEGEVCVRRKEKKRKRARDGREKSVWGA